ncbi:MAG: putative LPS assembly protein LptD [Flavobacteriales bacterium]
MLLSTSNAQEVNNVDYLNNDSVVSDNPIESKINSYAKDSIDYDLKNNKVYLYNEAKVEYENIILKAAFIELDSDKNIVFATTLKNDSTGEVFGYPEFSENGKQFIAEEITYNFDTKKGIIKNVKTQEGEGFILGDKVKKTPDNIVYTQKGRYTTCNHDPPHFSIRSKRIKTIPDKCIITGPAILEFSGVPTPLALPFGYFPNQKKKSSGIIFPFYGESANQGFFLSNGGYYFALSNYMDLSLTGDIYTKGSWNIKLNSKYKKRYKFNGSFDINYSSIKTGNSIIGNLIDRRDFFVRWRHQQDPKASPKSRFSANINAGSSSYQQNNSTSDSDYLKNTFQSAISYSRSFGSSNLSINLRHSQNTLTNQVDLTLPEISYNVNRFYPFKSFNKSTKSKWYDKIALKYTTNFKNLVSETDTLLFEKSTLSKFRNGVLHTIPISTSFNTLKYINISPSFNYSERWYFDRIEKLWNSNGLITDTINGFNRVYNYGFNLSANTKLYGNLNLKSNKFKAIRHVISPSVRFNYTPDFSSLNFNYFDEVQIDSLGNTQTYSFYQNGIYGVPSRNSSSILGFSIGNLLEMKVSSKDTINPIKKLKLIESLTISTNYNIEADSLKFSLVNINGRTRLFNKVNLNFSAVFDPYQKTSSGIRTNSFYFSKTNLPARFVRASSSINFRLNSNSNNDDLSHHWLDYVDFDIPWNLGVNYTLDYNKLLTNNALNQSLNFSGDLKLTDKWKIGFNSGYDFDNRVLSYTSLNLYRDLHCWEMLVKWIPFGFRQSYTFTIRVKASVLQDLKWERKKDWYDY